MDHDSYIKQCAKRRRQMRKLRERGWKLERIAKKFGVSRQRVHAVVKDVAVFPSPDR